MYTLYRGQWKPFLIIYSGFFIFNNIVRPIRLGISMAVVAPQWDRLLQHIQTQYRVSRTVAIAITVVMAMSWGRYRPCHWVLSWHQSFPVYQSFHNHNNNKLNGFAFVSPSLYATTATTTVRRMPTERRNQ